MIQRENPFQCVFAAMETNLKCDLTTKRGEPAVNSQGLKVPVILTTELRDEIFAASASSEKVKLISNMNTLRNHKTKEQIKQAATFF